LNLRELSAHLGLSQTTVSRALNGYPDVALETRRRVAEAAERFGYRPNASARRLATGRAHALGVAFPVDQNLLLDPHYIEFIAGLAGRAGEAGLDLMVSATRRNESEVYRRLARTRGIDATILSGPMIEDGRIDLLRSIGLPFVVHGRTGGVPDYAFLDIDNRATFRQAAQLLVDLGHRVIGAVNGDPVMAFAYERRLGWEEALTASGLTADPTLCLGGPMTEENGYRFARQLLERSPRPTGILCASVLSALGAYRAVRDLGLRVGRDVSIVAHDDGLPFIPPETMDPPMTVTRSPIRIGGERAAELALGLIAGRPVSELQQVLPFDLIYRASTAAPRSLARTV